MKSLIGLRAPRSMKFTRSLKNLTAQVIGKAKKYYFGGFLYGITSSFLLTIREQ
jgi:hypothetical protein